MPPQTTMANQKADTWDPDVLGKSTSTRKGMKRKRNHKTSNIHFRRRNITLRVRYFLYLQFLQILPITYSSHLYRGINPGLWLVGC